MASRIAYDSNGNRINTNLPGNPTTTDYHGVVPYDPNNESWQDYLIKRAQAGDEASLDKYLNFMLSEESNQIAREWTAFREDSAVQRFAEDARKAGFNPAGLLALGGSPIASSSSGSSYSGSQYTTDRHNQNSEAKNWVQVILSLVGTAMMAIALA